MAADPKTQRKFIDTDFREWADKLSAADVKAFGQLKAAIIKGDAKAEKANKTFLTNKGSLDAQLEAAKITSKARIAAVYNKVRIAEEDWQARNNMKYTPQDEFNETVKSVIGVTQKNFFSSDDRVYNLAEELDLKDSDSINDFREQIDRVVVPQYFINDIKARAKGDKDYIDEFDIKLLYLNKLKGN
jgi:hypothetical protein